jgi:hypothetical protein
MRTPAIGVLFIIFITQDLLKGSALLVERQNSRR